MTSAVSLCPLSLPSTASGEMLCIPSRCQGRSERSITVPSAPCICFLLLLELFPILIETRKLTLVSRSRCAKIRCFISLLQAFGYSAIIQLVSSDEKYLFVEAVFEPVLVAELTSTAPFTDQYW